MTRGQGFLRSAGSSTVACVDNDWLGPRPTLAEQVAECRRILADFDSTSWQQMDALFYQQGYEELRINLELLLELLAAQPPELSASESPSA